MKEEGNKFAEAGDFSAAIRTLDEAISLDPSSATLHELKAQVVSLVSPAEIRT